MLRIHVLRRKIVPGASRGRAEIERPAFRPSIGRCHMAAGAQSSLPLNRCPPLGNSGGRGK